MYLKQSICFPIARVKNRPLYSRFFCIFVTGVPLILNVANFQEKVSLWRFFLWTWLLLLCIVHCSFIFRAINFSNARAPCYVRIGDREEDLKVFISFKFIILLSIWRVIVSVLQPPPVRLQRVPTVVMRSTGARRLGRRDSLAATIIALAVNKK